MFEVDFDWLDANYNHPDEDGEYNVIASDRETRATYRSGKWSRDDVQAYKAKE